MMKLNDEKKGDSATVRIRVGKTNSAGIDDSRRYFSLEIP